MARDQGRGPDDDQLERLLTERGGRLMGLAIALTGSQEDGEDLLQAALERLLRHRRNVTADPEAYLRRTLYNLAADGWRRRGRWRSKVPLLAGQAGLGPGTAADAIAAVDLRDALAGLLRRLPPRQRAVIVLRYWEQLSLAEAAETLGCSPGTIKSSAAKGLRRLRELAGSWPDAEAGSWPDTEARPWPDTEARPAPHMAARWRPLITPAQPAGVAQERA